MPTCVAFGCTNRSSKKMPDTTFHSFPKDPEVREKWIAAVRRENWTPTSFSTICSMHFKRDDFDRTSLVCVRIKKGAIPSVFPAFPQHLQPKTRKERRPLKRKLSSEPSSLEAEEIPAIAEDEAIDEPNGVCINETILQERNGNLETAVVEYRRKIRTLQQFKRRAVKKVAKLKDILDTLQSNNFLEDELCVMLGSISKTTVSLVKRQVAKAKNEVTPRHYDPALRAFAVTLNFLSPRAYEFVRESFDTCLPHPRTLSKWYCAVNAEPGFCGEALSAVSHLGEMKVCALVFDFMSIRKHLEWGGTRWYGTVDNCDGHTCEAPLATEVLVYHLVCLNGSWKVPVGFFFANGMNGAQVAELTLQCLIVLHESNVRVVSITCDGAAANISMARILGCNLDPHNLDPSFVHPKTGERVFLFLDACHMLKLVRNTLGDLKVIFNQNGERIEWRYIKALVDLQEQESLHLGNKLRKVHVDFYRQKMKVTLAAQVLSRSVGNALEYCRERNLDGFHKSESTSEFLFMFDHLFDLLNSRSLYGKEGKQALNASNIDNARVFLLEMKKYMI